MISPQSSEEGDPGESTTQSSAGRIPPQDTTQQLAEAADEDEAEQESSAFKDLLEYLDITNIEIKQGQSNDMPPEECKAEPAGELEKLLLEESKEEDSEAFVAQSLDQVDRVLDEQLKKSSESQGSNAS